MREKDSEILLEDKVAKILPNLGKEIHIQTKSAERVPKKMNRKRPHQDTL